MRIAVSLFVLVVSLIAASAAQEVSLEPAEMRDRQQGNLRDDGCFSFWDNGVLGDRFIAEGSRVKLTVVASGRTVAGEPFFIACGFRRPHLPRMTLEEYFAAYDPQSLPLPENAPVPRPGGDPKKPAASADSRRAAPRCEHIMPASALWTTNWAACWTAWIG